LGISLSLKSKVTVEADIINDCANKNWYIERRSVGKKVLSNTVLPCKFQANKPISFSTANFRTYLNPLNTALYPICHLLALLGANHILHLSRIRVNKHCKNLNNSFVSESVMPDVFVRHRLINYLMSKQASVRRPTP
jgi:hypothetical protein